MSTMTSRHAPVSFLRRGKTRWILAVEKCDGTLESRFLSARAPGGISGVFGRDASECAALGAQSWATRSGAMRAWRRETA